jgi:DNA-binding NarL/FixJ family response regulator
MTPIAPIRLMIAEDQPLIREALVSMLGQQPDIVVVASAMDGEQAIQLSRGNRPDVILMDLQMPRLDGIPATRKILMEFPLTRIIILTTFDTDDLVFEAIGAGACSYLLKETPIPEIADAVRAAARGESRMSSSIARKVLGEFRRLRPARATGAAEAIETLNDREQQVLDLIAHGKSNSEIADAMSLAEGTVKNYVSRILDKLHAKNRTELAMKAAGHRRD